MVTITASVTPDARTTRSWRPGRARAAAASVGRRAAARVSAARLSPALTLTGLALVDTSAWTTYGRGAGLLATGISALLYDWYRDR